MSFLDKVWRDLKEKKKSQPDNKQVEFKSVYKGYRTIPIQSLPRMEANECQKIEGTDIWKQRSDTKIYTYMENAPLANQCNNGFFDSFYWAYMSHGDLKLKPDEVWMMIMLWFSKYVNDNAEQLRQAFVKHAGKMELTVETDRNLEDWVPFMEGVIEEIKKNTVQNVVEKLQCNFSTTGFFEQMFSTALIMNTCKKYFDYTRMGAGCGIVNVHMAGTLQDWQNLEKKLINLEQFDVNGGLKRYVRGLLPVLEQFTETYKGYANLQFWNNLYFQRQVPQARAYQPSTFINGWLIKFFTSDDEITDVEQLQSFSVDIKYIDIITKQTTYFNLNGGCKGYSCVDDFVYTPHYSFAIVIDQKKMRKMAKQQDMKYVFDKHKQRISKKSMQTTPIIPKKVVTLQFQNQLKLNSHIPGFQPQRKAESAAKGKNQLKASNVLPDLPLRKMSLLKQKVGDYAKRNK